VFFSVEGWYAKTFYQAYIEGPFNGDFRRRDILIDNSNFKVPLGFRYNFLRESHEQEGFSVMKFIMPWISISNYPDPYNTPSASLIYNNKAYSGFGDGEYNRFWKFDPVTSTWNQLNDFPGTRRQHFGFTAGSKGYIAGTTEYLVIAPELWEYDFANDSWTKKLDPPIAGVIRVAFGLQNTGYMLENNQSNTQLWKYNQNTDTWTMESTAPFSLGIDPGYFVIGKRFTLLLITIYGNMMHQPINGQILDKRQHT